MVARSTLADMPGLCELHVHIGGCLGPDDLLALARGRAVDWSAADMALHHAYGEWPRLEAQVAAALAGEPGARERFARTFVFGDADAGDFDRFLAHFAIISAVLNDQVLTSGMSAEATAEVTSLSGILAAGCRAQGIGHCDVRVMLGAGIPPSVRAAYYRALLTGFRAVSGPDLTLRLAVSLPRTDPWPAWQVVRELVLSELGEFLTAVDFCHVEEGHPPARLRPFADHLRAFNTAHPHRAVALLYHVGESWRDKRLASAIRWCDEAACDLGAHRLGHAIALGIDPAHPGARPTREPVSERLAQVRYDLTYLDALRAHGVRLDGDALRAEAEALGHLPPDHVLDFDGAESLADIAGRQAFALERIRAAGAVVEVCPTSNRRIAGLGDPAHHPVHRFARAGLPFVVGSDDPGLLGITLADELAWTEDQTGIDRQVLTTRAWASRSEVLSGRRAPD